MQFRFFAVIAATLIPATPSPALALDWTSADAVARAVVADHPALAAARADVDAATERVRAAGSYPNPMLMGGVENQQIDLSQDEMMTMYMIGASQTIVRGNRRDALTRSAQLDVEELRLEAQSVREEIRRDALSAWYDLAAADSKIAATEQLAAATDAIVAAARFRYEVGTTIQADVLRAQLQRSNLSHQLLRLAGERDAAASRLLAQLGLPLTTAIPRLHLPHGTEARGIDRLPVVPESHPALAALAARIGQREQQIRLARLIQKPDWNLQASYGLRTEQKDVFSVMARVELPIRKTSLIEPQIRAAIAEREAVARQLDALRRRLLQDLGIAYSVHAESTRQIRLHEEVLLPQSKLAFESTLAAYQSGKDIFEAVLSTHAGWLALEIDYFDFLRRHIKAVVDFEAIERGARSGALAAMAQPSSLAMDQPAMMRSLSGGKSAMRFN